MELYEEVAETLHYAFQSGSAIWDELGGPSTKPRLVKGEPDYIEFELHDMNGRTALVRVVQSDKIKTWDDE
jgi:hypothetical protein